MTLGAGVLAIAWRACRFLLLAGALTWIGAVGTLWIFQRHLLYMAPREPPGPPPPGFEAVQLMTADGLALLAWHCPPAPGRPTIVVFTGQGGSLPASAEWSDGLIRAGLGILLVAYRGFDGNSGAPSEAGLYRDGRAALAWLAAHGVPDPVLLGVSLGSGVATELAVEAVTRPPDWPAGSRPRALVLLSAYESIPEVAAGRYPLVPVRLLAKDRFDNLAKIGRVRMPVLVVHGALDELVPFAQGKAVYDAAPSPKLFLGLPAGGHNFPSAEILPAIEELLTL